MEIFFSPSPGGGNWPLLSALISTITCLPFSAAGFLGMFPNSEFWQFTSIQLLDHLIRGTIHINNHLTIWWKGPATKSCRSGSATIFLLLIWGTSADMRDKFLPIKSCSICRGSAKALTAFINVIRIFSHNFFWEEKNSPQNQPRLILSLPLLLPASSFERP